jgi:hypothetical protein
MRLIRIAALLAGLCSVNQFCLGQNHLIYLDRTPGSAAQDAQEAAFLQAAGSGLTRVDIDNLPSGQVQGNEWRDQGILFIQPAGEPLHLIAQNSNQVPSSPPNSLWPIGADESIEIVLTANSYALGFWLIDSEYGNSQETISFFDPSDNLISSFEMPRCGCLASHGSLQGNFFVGIISEQPIGRVLINELTLDTESVGIDDIFFSSCDPVAALEFDGVDDRLVIPYDEAFPETTFSLTAWIRAYQTDQFRTLVEYGEDDASDNAPWTLWITPDDELALNIENEPSKNNYNSGVVVADGTWHHVAAARSLAGQVDLYVDGILVKSFSASVTPGGSSQDLTIGCGTGISGPPISPQPRAFFFHGSIDEVSIWDTALTPQQIETIHSDGIAAPVATDLVGYWRLDENVGQAASDSSGNSWHATLGETSSSESDDPTWRTSEAPTCCEDQEICLNFEPNRVNVNETLELVLSGGGPGQLASLWITGVDGTPAFVPVVIGVFGADETLRLSSHAEPGSGSLDVSLIGLAFSSSGGIASSNLITVVVR